MIVLSGMVKPTPSAHARHRTEEANAATAVAASGAVADQHGGRRIACNLAKEFHQVDVKVQSSLNCGFW